MFPNVSNVSVRSLPLNLYSVISVGLHHVLLFVDFLHLLIQIIDLEWNALDFYGHISDSVSKSQRKGYLSKYTGIFKMKAL